MQKQHSLDMLKPQSKQLRAIDERKDINNEQNADCHIVAIFICRPDYLLVLPFYAHIRFQTVPTGRKVKSNTQN